MPQDAFAPASIMIQRRLEWSDTDASGHYHNSAALRMFESAEDTIFESLELQSVVSGRTPRVRIEADFRRTLSHRDLLDVHLRISEVGRTSVTFTGEILRDGETCVQIMMKIVLVGGDGPEPWSEEHKELMLRAGPQPPELMVRG